MLPSRGLVQSSQALRLRQVTPARYARNFSTAMRRSGAPIGSPSVSGLALGQSGRHVLNTNTNNSLNTLRTPPSSAAAFSLWPFGGSKKFNEAELLGRSSTAPSAASSPAASPATENISSAASSAPSAPSSTQYTSPVVESTPATPDVSATTSSSNFPDVFDPNAISDILDGSTLLDMADNHIGYLNALGLDFGWGPTAMCQWVLEHVHVWTGLPWWASIVGTAVLFRAAIFFPSLTAAENSAKMQVLRRNPRYALAMEEMQKSAFKGGQGGQAKAMEARLTMKRMQEAANVSTLKMFAPMINIPIGYGMFRLLRSMSLLPVPSMETGGILWFTDLTVSDPYMLLPCISAGIMYFIFRSNMKYMAPEQQQTMKYVQMFLTPVSIFVTIKMSAGVTFFFAVSSFLQLIQTWLWHQPWLRNWKGLPPMHEMLDPGSIGGGGGSGGPAAASRQAHPVSFRLDPDSSWKAPRATSTGAQESDSSSGAPTQADLDKAAEQSLPQPPSALEAAKKGWSKLVGSAKDKQAASKDKEVLRRAQDYEKKRRIEDETKAYQRREAERQYRTAKKTLDASKNAKNKWQ